MIHNTYEHYKKEARAFAGPACIETFGEAPFSPAPKPEALKLTGQQEEMVRGFDSRQSALTNQYIPGDERSFTIVAYPVPEVGERYPDRKSVG